MTQEILIVEDDPNTSFLFNTILKRAGYHTKSAVNSDEAIQHIQSSNPDVILLDLGLPGMNGIELLKMIRKTPHLTHTKVVIISAYTDLIQKARESSADALITKPVGAKQLLDVVANILAS